MPLRDQLSLCLCMYELCACLGFLLFPCQPLDLSYDDADTFVVVCVALSALGLFSLMAAYSWLFVVALHINRLVAKVRRIERRCADLKYMWSTQCCSIDPCYYLPDSL